MNLLLLAGLAITVGFFMGAVGVGGILLIPFLTILSGLTIHEATATALFSFLFTGIFGAWQFQRRGKIDWRMIVPMCVGAVVFSYVGAMLSSMIAAKLLAQGIGAITMFAGAYLFMPSRHSEGSYRDGSQRFLLLTVGAVSGLGSGLSGAGGPLFSVPMMLVLGFVPLTTIGASQVLQIVAAISGTIGNLQYGSIDFGTAGWITLCEFVGIAIGSRTGHAMSVAALRSMAAALCVAVGLFMLVR